MPTTTHRLSRQVQCRFSDRQYELLRQVADESNRPISAIVRDVVTVWAMQHGGPDPLVDTRARNRWVREMVAELRQLGDEDHYDEWMGS